MGKSWTDCFAASIRIKQLATLEVIVNFGENGKCADTFLEDVTAVNMPLNCR